ncbi:hypothetical protein FRC12_024987 [Ceratobasidium sp. 428]|nr:hypothetical protein FRC12_024987 [Ceratobasidium sp. 428]
MCEHIQLGVKVPLYASADFAPIQDEDPRHLRYHGNKSFIDTKLLNQEGRELLPVTIKAVRTEPDEDLEKARDNELRIWRLLDPNPNIARFLGTGQLDEWPFDRLSLVSEFYVSRDANKFLEENDLPDMQRLELLKNVLRGILHIHEKSIVHGDLKGTNILVESNGNVAKICDFGSSLINCGCYAGPEAETQTGSLPWDSPERCKGGKPTTQSDIWAFGCIVLEIQMQTPPHRNISHVRVAMRLLGGILPATETELDLSGQVQRAVWDTVQGCWDLEPSKRPSAAALLMALEEIVV